MVVALSFPIVATGSVAKAKLTNQTRLFQETKRVINRRETDSGQQFPRRRKYLARRRMMCAALDGPQDRFPLGRQAGLFILLSYSPGHLKWN